ncbi:MazG-like family protein [Pasteurella sp. PK-2025]|uniref:MazG-like family protein n=1 Tax=Pasteurella sp. PK-2025 TaxID=3413133 RepID=UPI003C71DA48
MCEIKELIEKIEQWAEDRNLIEGSTPQKQVLKLMEEFGELCGGIAKNKPDVIKDSIGDCAVVLIILAKQLNFKVIFLQKNKLEYVESTDYLPRFAMNSSRLMFYLSDRDRTVTEFDFRLTQQYLTYICIQQGFTFTECLERAWNDIKDRKGRMVDGFFVKEEDL